MALGDPPNPPATPPATVPPGTGIGVPGVGNGTPAGTPPVTPTTPKGTKPPATKPGAKPPATAPGAKPPAAGADAAAASIHYKVFHQPTFDPRIYKRHVITAGQAPASPNQPDGKLGTPSGPDVDTKARGMLTRGKIRQEKAFPGWSEICEVDFLYNPSTIDATYGIQQDADTLAALMFPNKDDDGVLNIMLNQTVTGIDLLFDRTFELWDSKYVNTDVGKYGVQMDVLAFMQLVGMTGGANIKDPSKTPDPDKTIEKLNGAYGVMRPTRCYVIIGGRGALTFFGIITGFSVSYTHWSQYMVPMRCVISASLQLLPLASAGGAAVGGTDHGALMIQAGGGVALGLAAQKAAEGALANAKGALAKAKGAPATGTPATTAPAKANKAGR